MSRFRYWIKSASAKAGEGLDFSFSVASGYRAEQGPLFWCVCIFCLAAAAVAALSNCINSVCDIPGGEWAEAVCWRQWITALQLRGAYEQGGHGSLLFYLLSGCGFGTGSFPAEFASGWGGEFPAADWADFYSRGGSPWMQRFASVLPGILGASAGNMILCLAVISGGGLAMSLFLNRLWSNGWGALAGGLIFALNPLTLSALNSLNYEAAWLGFGPLLWFLLLYAARTRRRRYAAGAAAVLCLEAACFGLYAFLDCLLIGTALLFAIRGGYSENSEVLEGLRRVFTPFMCRLAVAAVILSVLLGTVSCFLTDVSVLDCGTVLMLSALVWLVLFLLLASVIRLNMPRFWIIVFAASFVSCIMGVLSGSPWTNAVSGFLLARSVPVLCASAVMGLGRFSGFMQGCGAAALVIVSLIFGLNRGIFPLQGFCSQNASFYNLLSGCGAGSDLIAELPVSGKPMFLFSQITHRRKLFPVSEYCRSSNSAFGRFLESLGRFDCTAGSGYAELRKNPQLAAEGIEELRRRGCRIIVLHEKAFLEAFGKFGTQVYFRNYLALASVLGTHGMEDFEPVSANRWGGIFFENEPLQWRSISIFVIPEEECGKP